MESIIKGIYKVQQVCLYIAALFMGCLAVFVFYDVVARYLFNAPTIWAHEVSIYLLQFIVFFTMGIIQMEGKHLRVTFLVDRLKGNARKMMEALTSFLIIPYSLVLVVCGYRFTENSFVLGMKSPTLLQVPLWIPYSFISIGGILLTVAAICSVIKVWIPQQES